MPDRKTIVIAKPTLGEREAEAARRAILSGWVVQGPEVRAFEREFAELVGASHATAVSSGTAALHLALLTLGVAEGDEVVTVSHSHIATANSVRYCGATPVFVDIDPRTFNLDPACLDAAIGPRCRAVLLVHQIGMPANLAAILDIAHRRGVPVVEDAACAIGSEIRWGDRWMPIGRPHTDFACFSFHPRKLITTGDGGMVTTQNAEWDATLRLLREHAVNVSAAARDRTSEVVFENHAFLAFNYRMTDIQGAIGREQLKRLPVLLARRRELAARYAEHLRDVPDVVPPAEPEWARTNWQSYCVWLPDGADQRTVMQRMLDAGVNTRRGVACAHRQPAYPRGTWREVGGLTISERASDHALMLPLHDELTDDDVRRIVDSLRAALRGS